MNVGSLPLNPSLWISFKMLYQISVFLDDKTKNVHRTLSQTQVRKIPQCIIGATKQQIINNRTTTLRHTAATTVCIYSRVAHHV